MSDTCVQVRYIITRYCKAIAVAQEIIIIGLRHAKRLHSINTFSSIQLFYKWTGKVLIRLHRCAGWSGTSLSADVWRHVFSWRRPMIHLPQFIPLVADGFRYINFSRKTFTFQSPVLLTLDGNSSFICVIAYTLICFFFVGIPTSCFFWGKNVIIAACCTE